MTGPREILGDIGYTRDAADLEPVVEQSGTAAADTSVRAGAGSTDEQLAEGLRRLAPQTSPVIYELMLKGAERIAALSRALSEKDAEIARLRAALEVHQQTVAEVRLAFEQGPEWYTKGESGLRNQVRLHLDRDAEASAALTARPAASQAEGVAALERLKDSIDYRLNEHLCGMKEGWDDSVVGFNEAWDIVREFFKRRIAAAHPQGGKDA